MAARWIFTDDLPHRNNSFRSLLRADGVGDWVLMDGDGAMKKRRPITNSMKLDSLLWFNEVRCFWCHIRLWPQDYVSHGETRAPIHWDHATPLAMGGKHDYENLRPMHEECHRIKTRGCTGTSKKGSVANGDTHKIAKAVRLANPKQSKHPFPKTNRKMQSRPFPKRVSL